MLKSLVSLTTVCALALTAPLAFADPEDPAPVPAQPVANDAPPPPDGFIASAEPGNLITPDGWTVTVAGKNETLLPVAPLTTALSSREYIVGGSFIGAVSGAGKTKLAGGSLEAGYQIGCGIMGGPVELTAGIGLSGGFGTGGLTSVSLPINGLVKVDLKPGQVTIVPVNKKTFEGKTTRTTITGFRIKIDSCVGQSFIRSYATMTSSTDNTDDVVTYMGVTKAV
ncbi:MspA family porin [Mycobacteroides franklinii]|uniref:MspA n=1 Tax=Mycobacteroides franklinii TaxID=948102 RepID=A0A4V3HUN7_9MYCO|nr:MspA family porin [Mycobacteroides franklinii]NGX08249.1 MspA protein [Mycobacteroides franklinii]ORA60282.1 MspA protein [Mycobacteroides franklinii]TDH20463.1 MspA protein [Mycobacteroides franklinii]TDZ45492.1 MspA [Mycobacteroides franklinii]TDZ48983.1 MspA [Mycobacteroides franklinii]